MRTEADRAYGREKMRRWRAENREHWLAYQRAYKKARRSADPEAARSADRERYKRTGARQRALSAAARARRTALIASLKDRPCADCGGRFHHAAMHFDHLPERGPKAFNISREGSKLPLHQVLAEIELCEVVCANCHAVRTFQRRKAA